jgi:lysophospholipase L1-like esterase
MLYPKSIKPAIKTGEFSMWQNYIAIGDSVTAGTGDPVQGMEMHGWTDGLADWLATQNPGFTYTNLGWAGSTTRDVLRNQLPLVLEGQPDLVSVTTGANDARDPAWTLNAFTREFNALLQPIADQGTVILTMTYPGLRLVIPRGWNNLHVQWQLYFERMKDTNAVIRNISAHLDACLLDLENSAQAQDPSHISTDLIHPNALGHKFAGEVAIQILSKRIDLKI